MASDTHRAIEAVWRLDYQAVSAMITRGIVFGGEAKGEPGARRQLVTMTTVQISKFIDAQTW